MRGSESLISICSRKVLKQKFLFSVINTDSLGFNYVVRSLLEAIVYSRTQQNLYKNYKSTELV